MEYTYGEYISEADSEFIMECLACITEEDVRNSSDYKVFKRGQEYYREEMVEDKERIRKNLENAGNSHYIIIAESLDLMKRINPERSRLVTEDIRANFKKRRNLIDLIREF